MVLEMHAARLSETNLLQKVDSKKPKEVNISEEVLKEDIPKLEVKRDNVVNIDEVKKQALAINKVRNDCEVKVSKLQVTNEALSKDREILVKMQDLVKNTDFDSLSREEKVDVQEKLIKYVDDINKISINTTFNGKPLLDGSNANSDNDNNEVVIERVDSQTLGLSEDNISRLTLDSVRVAGESYMPPYTFDVTETAGASTALSVIGSAITKIDSYVRTVQIDISELTRYPECLEIDRTEYSNEQSKIRNADYARRLVSQLQNAIRMQIQEAQRSQVVAASEGITKLFR